MKKYIAVFEVPDGYKPTDYLENADGWFTDEEGNRCTVGTKLEEAKQGEWIIVKDEKWGDNVKCPFCGKELAGTDLNFCCKCGADLMKGDEI